MKIRWLACLLGLFCYAASVIGEANPVGEANPIGEANSTAGHSYVWPTNASYYLSSSFAEYRSGHFHAGIDIKTFGQNGFPVYATRSGYIWQIRVSPYGYGRVIYQKLDTGEIVVYAHLQRFMEKLEAEVNREQLRRQEFSIRKYFRPHEFPLDQGEIIAYTGESGIGPPHLHFEMRDPANNPINPLMKNFPVKDTVAPVIKRLAVLPLERATEINGDFETIILVPQFLGRDKYQIATPIQISGAIGLALDCYDPIDFVNNKLGIYTLKLFLDGQLIYAAKYDTFSYDQTAQIYLDRDFRLMRQGEGIFYRCFRDRNNELNFYGQFPPEAGIIHTRFFTPQLPRDFSGADSSHSDNSQTESRHSFKIEIADFFSNRTQITGEFIFQAVPELAPQFEIDENLRLHLVTPGEHAVRSCQKFSAFMSNDLGVSWYPVYSWNRRQNLPLPEGPHALTRLSPTFQGARILKILATDLAGQAYRPYFHVVQPSGAPGGRKAFLTLEKEANDDFIRFTIRTSTPVIEKPQIIIRPEIGRELQPDVLQTDLNVFQAFLKLKPKYSGDLKIEIQAESVDGKGMFHEEYYDLVVVTPGVETILKSVDGMCEVQFSRDGVYRPLYARIVTQEPEPMTGLDIRGLSYQITPYDIPLKKSATISVKYPADEPAPEQLGIYVKQAKGKSNWRFAGNTLDVASGSIRTEVSVFDEYTIIRDTEPPEIILIYPANGMRLVQRRPTIKVKITDRLSGLRGDSQHMRMLLDGNRVIAEYDPETKLLFFQPDDELSQGKHIVVFTARDRSGNVTEKEISFWIN